MVMDNRVSSYERYRWIDIVRILVIVLVVLCHSTEEGIYDFSLERILQMNISERM